MPEKPPSDAYSDDLSDEYLTAAEASRWASERLKRKVTPSNIAYLIQYGRVQRYEKDGAAAVSKRELLEYYRSYLGGRELDWQERLGGVNWELSFDQYKEAETTKHVHRLHPYKGKFIPQLAEYFLDGRTDAFKKEARFQPGDIVLDPFCGSGTALVQANELGMRAVGVDISEFNALVSNVKVGKHRLMELLQAAERIGRALRELTGATGVPAFEARLSEELSEFNRTHFPPREFKRKARLGEIDEKAYGNEKAALFAQRFAELAEEYGVPILQERSETFLDRWFLAPARREIDRAVEMTAAIPNEEVRRAAQVILSRTVRTCRATTHADLATLKEPAAEPYYCAKHGKVCRPLFSMIGWWDRYSHDTVQRLDAFSRLRTDTLQVCLTGDSRTIDIQAELERTLPELARLVRRRGVQGIFTSPPYVGLIDYHEQHAYSYDLFALERRDEQEIGPLFRGQGKKARGEYVEGVSAVLRNCKRVLVEDCDVYIVANDKHNLYETIAQKAEMRIVQRYERPVLNRTEKDKAAYSETIFHMKTAARNGTRRLQTAPKRDQTNVIGLEL